MRWLVLIPFGLLGTAALIYGIFLLSGRMALLENALSAEGVVVEQRIVHSTGGVRSRGNYNRGGADSYWPIIEFQTRSGETARFEGSVGGGGKPEIATGTRVDLFYNPADPTNAVVANFTQTWLGVVVFLTVGVIFLLMGVGGFFLIGKSDASMAAMDQVMARDRLLMHPDTIRFSGKIVRVETLDESGNGKYVYVCRGTRPGEAFPKEYRTDHFPFKPTESVIGQPVTIYLDPSESSRYRVDLEPETLRKVIKEH